MGNIIECNGQSSSRHTNKHFKNIRESLQIYADNNDLMSYDQETRRYIQKSFIFGQTHIGDKLIELTINNQRAQKESLMKDLLKVNFQQFDEICYKSTEFMKKKQNNSIFQVSQVKIRKIDSIFIKQGQRCLRLHNFLFIITIKCFGQSYSEDPFIETDLLTKKSKFQIFKQKIQALRLRYNCKLQVCIICSSHIYEKVQRQLQSDQTFIVIEYNPFQPCFRQKNQIFLQDYRIKFNETEGDLISLLFTHSILKQFQKKLDYIIFADIHNVVSPAINPAYLGLLNSRKNISILASIKLSQNNDILRIQNEFIKNQNLEFGDIIMKAQFLKAISSKNSYMAGLINQRIQRKKIEETDCYFFSRLPQDILHTSFSLAVKVPYNANNMIQLSNFCKQVLAVKNQEQNDLIEISPIILHGIPDQLQQIRQNLRQRSQQLSYPIIITKNREIQNSV